MGDRALPQVNRLVAARWDAYTLHKHKEQLAESKTVLNTSSPPVFSHLDSRRKMAQLNHDRATRIERDNLHLLEKMRHIMTEPQMNRQEPFAKDSLNREARKRDMIRIMNDNQSLLRRIQSRPSAYNTAAWDREYSQKEYLMHNISRFPQNTPYGEREREIALATTGSTQRPPRKLIYYGHLRRSLPRVNTAPAGVDQSTSPSRMGTASGKYHSYNDTASRSTTTSPSPVKKTSTGMGYQQVHDYLHPTADAKHIALTKSMCIYSTPHVMIGDIPATLSVYEKLNPFRIEIVAVDHVTDNNNNNNSTSTDKQDETKEANIEYGDDFENEGEEKQAEPVVATSTSSQATTASQPKSNKRPVLMSFADLRRRFRTTAPHLLQASNTSAMIEQLLPHLSFAHLQDGRVYQLIFDWTSRALEPVVTRNKSAARQRKEKEKDVEKEKEEVKEQSETNAGVDKGAMTKLQFSVTYKGAPAAGPTMLFVSVKPIGSHVSNYKTLYQQAMTSTSTTSSTETLITRLTVKSYANMDQDVKISIYQQQPIARVTSGKKKTNTSTSIRNVWLGETVCEMSHIAGLSNDDVYELILNNKTTRDPIKIEIRHIDPNQPAKQQEKQEEKTHDEDEGVTPRKAKVHTLLKGGYVVAGHDFLVQCYDTDDQSVRASQPAIVYSLYYRPTASVHQHVVYKHELPELTVSIGTIPSYAENRIKFVETLLTSKFDVVDVDKGIAVTFDGHALTGLSEISSARQDVDEYDDDYEEDTTKKTDEYGGDEFDKVGEDGVDDDTVMEETTVKEKNDEYADDTFESGQASAREEAVADGEEEVVDEVDDTNTTKKKPTSKKVIQQQETATEATRLVDGAVVLAAEAAEAAARAAGEETARKRQADEIAARERELAEKHLTKEEQEAAAKAAKEQLHAQVMAAGTAHIELIIAAEQLTGTDKSTFVTMHSRPAGSTATTHNKLTFIGRTTPVTGNHGRIEYVTPLPLPHIDLAMSKPSSFVEYKVSILHGDADTQVGDAQGIAYAYIPAMALAQAVQSATPSIQFDLIEFDDQPIKDAKLIINIRIIGVGKATSTSSRPVSAKGRPMSASANRVKSASRNKITSSRPSSSANKTLTSKPTSKPSSARQQKVATPVASPKTKETVTSPQTPKTPTGPKMEKVSISVACKNLPLSSSTGRGPVVALYAKDTNGPSKAFTYVSATERHKDCVNPAFSLALTLEYPADAEKKLSLAVYDVGDDSKITQQQLVGEATVTLAAFLEACQQDGATLVRPLMKSGQPIAEGATVILSKHSNKTNGTSSTSASRTTSRPQSARSRPSSRPATAQTNGALPPQITLTVSCQGLTLPGGVTGPVHPMVAVYQQDATGQYQYATQSEVIKSSSNPSFTQSIIIPTTSQPTQQLMFGLYHIDDAQNITEKNLIGSTILTQQQLLDMTRKQNNIYPLISQGTAIAGATISITRIDTYASRIAKDTKLRSPLTSPKQSVQYHDAEHGTVTPITISVSCTSLPNNIDPLVALYMKSAESNNFEYAGQTERVSKNPSPKFTETFSLPHYSLLDREIMFGVYDVSASSSITPDDLIGSVALTLNELLTCDGYTLTLPLMKDENTVQTATITLVASVPQGVTIDTSATVATSMDTDTHQFRVSLRNITPTGRDVMVALYCQEKDKNQFAYVSQTERQSVAGDEKSSVAFTTPIVLTQPASQLMFSIYQLGDGEQEITEDHQLGNCLLEMDHVNHQRGREWLLPVIDKHGNTVNETVLSVMIINQ